jgi:hypothetical protein
MGRLQHQETMEIWRLLCPTIELALKKRGYPTLAELKAKWERKGR